jgi:hypothetical protein
MLTQKRLKELFNYNPETGLFTRLVDRGNTKSGDIAGTTGKQGYTYISVDYKVYSAHRLAFLYMTGKIPNQVDHQDHIKNNNTWINLSPSNPELNAKNMFLPSHNTSGVIGTYWSNRRKCWYAEVNYPDLKDGASNVNGTSKNRRFTPSDLADSASASSTGDSRRYHMLRFIADVLGGIDIPVMQGATLITPP